MSIMFVDSIVDYVMVSSRILEPGVFMSCSQDGASL